MKIFSINSFVEFAFATETKKRRIIKDQKSPNTIKIARYRTPRAAFTNYFIKGFDVSVILKAIQMLQNREDTSKWSKNDKVNSLKALHLFLEIAFPFQNLKCTFGRDKFKHVKIGDILLNVAPDLILTWEENGEKYIGAIKFQIKKKSLTLQEGQLSSSLIYHFLINNYPNYKVAEKYCLSIDVMNKRKFIPNSYEYNITIAEQTCRDISNMWMNVA